MTILYHYLIFCTSGIVFSIFFNHLLIKFSTTLGIRNKNDVTMRWSNQSKPSLGGISFFLTLLSIIILYLFLNPSINLFILQDFTGFFLASSLAFIIGIFDDAYNTRPLLKLSGQICCGLVIAYTGNMIEITAIPLLNVFITTFWVVLLMNSLNLLDNMDGITGITSIFILITCFSLNQHFRIDSNQFWNLMLLAIIGSLIGFLFFNSPPAKLFMGDSGSQYLGLIVAFFSIKFIFGAVSIANSIPLWQVILGLMVCFCAPLIDTFTVFFNRIKRNSSPFIGGKDHTTHHLIYKGYSEKQVFYCFALIGSISALLTYLLFMHAGNTINWFSFVALAWFLFVFYFLYKNTLMKSQENK